MGSISLVSGMLSLLLPETKDKELPEFLSQIKPLRWWVTGRTTFLYLTIFIIHLLYILQVYCPFKLFVHLTGLGR